MSTIAVAKKAGVSPATVSRVFNRRPGVSQEKIERVTKAMAQLGYHPATSAQKRLGAHSRIKYGNIGVLVLASNMLQDYSSVFQKSLRSVEEALGERQLNAIKGRVETLEQVPPLVAAGQVDGLILAGNPSEEVEPHLSKFPASWITSRRGNRSDTTLAGNELIGRMAAEYLLGRGHQRLAIFNALAAHPPLNARADYFEFAATRAGAKVDTLVAADLPERYFQASCLDLEWLERQVEGQVDKLLALKPRPTGLFVMMDHQAAVLYRVLAKRGIRPGRDLDIIGCDDEKSVLLGLYPRPATIRISGEAIGRRAVEQLLWRIAHPNETAQTHVVVEPELIPGEIE